MKLLIVIFGNKRAGKNTLGEAIRVGLDDLRGIRTHTIAFADRVKLVGEVLVGIPHDLPEDEKEIPKFYGKSARKWWQWIGTEVGREQVHRDLWPINVANFVARSTTLEPAWVVTDGRFENERTVPKRRLEDLKVPTIVRNVLVYRPGLPDDDPHPSEAEVREMRRLHLSGTPLFDYVVENNSDIARLNSKGAELATKFAIEYWTALSTGKVPSP